MVAVATGAHAPKMVMISLFIFRAFRGPPLCVRDVWLQSSEPKIFFVFILLVFFVVVVCFCYCCCCFERAVCADFKSYPKTIPTEIIYYRLGLTTQLKQWYVAALHNFLYTFLRVKLKSMPFALLSLSRHLPPRLLAHTQNAHTRSEREKNLPIEFSWIFFPVVARLSTQCWVATCAIYFFKPEWRNHSAHSSTGCTYGMYVIDVVFLEFHEIFFKADYACRSFYFSQLFFFRSPFIFITHSRLRAFSIYLLLTLIHSLSLSPYAIDSMMMTTAISGHTTV